jgi:histidine decarboxylase
VQEGFALADYLIDRLGSHGIHAWRHRNSLTVVFERPTADVAQKWQIPVYGDIAHVCTLSHITREQLDDLIDDLVVDASVSNLAAA